MGEGYWGLGRKEEGGGVSLEFGGCVDMHSGVVGRGLGSLDRVRHVYVHGRSFFRNFTIRCSRRTYGLIRMHFCMPLYALIS